MGSLLGPVATPRDTEPQRDGRQRAFTLIELLVVVAVVGILASLIFPALAQAKQRAQTIQCINHLRQLGLATRMYWDDHNDTAFKYLTGSTNGGALYWFGWLANGSEGERAFDAAPGALYPYLRGLGVELCPSLNYSLGRFKLKATGAAYGYGYNLHVSTNEAGGPRNLQNLRDPSATALFADAAQVNDFQAPASADHPMLEEWYYLDVGEGTFSYPNAHFRHQAQANVVFLDGHVGRERPAPGTLDDRMPSEKIARLRRAVLLP